MYEDILNSIIEDISWRTAELQQIELASDKLSDVEKRVLLKSAIPLIYAHWEGFIVSSVKSIFDFLNKSELESYLLCDNLLTTAYEQSLTSIVASSGFDKRRKHLKTIQNMLGQKVKFENKIDTRSNLKFEILEEICEKLNINIAKFKEYKSVLNRLVDIRNSIAHGENSFVFEDYDSIQEYVVLLEELMLIFVQEIKEFLEDEKYKRIIDESI
jgi:hypothetical protein